MMSRDYDEAHDPRYYEVINGRRTLIQTQAAAMNYRVVPIRTVEDLDAALTAGVEGEFTAHGDAYNLPRCAADRKVRTNSRGWVPSELASWRKHLKGSGQYAAELERGTFRLRAFYPAD